MGRINNKSWRKPEVWKAANAGCLPVCLAGWWYPWYPQNESFSLVHVHGKSRWRPSPLGRTPVLHGSLPGSCWAEVSWSDPYKISSRNPTDSNPHQKQPASNGNCIGGFCKPGCVQGWRTMGQETPQAIDVLLITASFWPHSTPFMHSFVKSFFWFLRDLLNLAAPSSIRSPLWDVEREAPEGPCQPEAAVRRHPRPDSPVQNRGHRDTHTPVKGNSKWFSDASTCLPLEPEMDMQWIGCSERRWENFWSWNCTGWTFSTQRSKAPQ